MCVKALGLKPLLISLLPSDNSNVAVMYTIHPEYTQLSAV